MLGAGSIGQRELLVRQALAWGAEGLRWVPYFSEPGGVGGREERDCTCVRRLPSGAARARDSRVPGRVASWRALPPAPWPRTQDREAGRHSE